MKTTTFFNISDLTKSIGGFSLSLCLAFGAAQGHAQTLPQQVAGQELPSLAPIIDRVAPGVVNISVQSSVETDNQLSQDPFFRRFLPPDNRREVQSAGSGVIVDAKNGYILTNHHVIENADEITVSLMDDRTLKAEVVGSDAGSDIAVLQVDPDGLLEMPLGNSDELRVGDFVFAIGNPFRLRHTVTSGIVSGLGRTGINPEGYEDFIQTDASINPGNSGGALINQVGELVGINTAIFSRSGGYQGIGFAVPSNLARRVMNDLISYGEVRRGSIGYVEITPLTNQLAEQLGISNPQGVLIRAIDPNSVAYRAGLRAGDVIVSFDENNITDPAHLSRLVQDAPADTIKTITLIRERNKLEIKVPIELPQTRQQRP